MKTIYVDADACSVKDEVYKVSERYGWRTFVVANQPIRTPASRRIFAIQVSQGADAADDWIAEKAGPGDIVVTADIPLADRSLKKGARVLGFKGREFTTESIGEALASRELSQQLREMNIETGGPAPMTARDKSTFLGRLDQLVNAVLKDERTS